jgi:hypothetical protein
MIDRKCWTAAVCLGLMTLLGGHRLAAAGPAKKQSDELKAKMVAEGWTPISDSVFERQLGPTKVEHLGYGREGLAWTINKLTRQLESLMIEYESYPSEDLDKVIDDLSVQIAKAKREMRNAPQGITSMTEAVTGPSCSSICYSATADAYPLTSTQGVGAVSQAKFNSACGYSGDTYAYAYVRATQGGTTNTFSQEDPRTGTNVTSSASASMNGGLDCFSEAAATVSSYALETYYSTSDANYSCPPPALNVTMSGPSSADFTTATCSTLTWSASASGGTTPYSYNWYYNGTQVGTGTSYSRSVCYNHADFTIQATVTDSSSPVQTKSVSRAVDVTFSNPFTVTINGSNYEYFEYMGSCRNVTWTSTISGGTSPYTYQWKIGTTVVGTGSSYTKSVCRSQQPGFTLTLSVTGSNSVSATDDHFVTVERGEYDGGCGTNGQICP